MVKFIRKLGYIYGGILFLMLILGGLYQLIFYSYIENRVETLKEVAGRIEFVQAHKHSEMKIEGNFHIEKKIGFNVYVDEQHEIILSQLINQFKKKGWVISKVNRRYYGFKAYNDKYVFIASPIVKKSKITGEDEFTNEWAVIFYYNNFFARSNI
ncbi:hypothetical protein [Veillonella sp. R32]|uniref:hypothetical protein n=1 Tax=Veillonella sp. R32 TaxID=2021312 RepID=UPI001389969E|nr:hypothetical protein [Veillonella sp. R32]KAF1683822.1 hypothetical protein VER_01325 [Veillonella sp. R32]